MKRQCGGLTLAVRRTLKCSLTPPLQTGGKSHEILFSQDKSSLIEKAKGCVHRQRIIKIVILYFPSAGSVQTFPGKQGLVMHSDFSGR